MLCESVAIDDVAVYGSRPIMPRNHQHASELKEGLDIAKICQVEVWMKNARASHRGCCAGGRRASHIDEYIMHLSCAEGGDGCVWPIWRFMLTEIAVGTAVIGRLSEKWLRLDCCGIWRAVWHIAARFFPALRPMALLLLRSESQHFFT